MTKKINFLKKRILQCRNNERKQWVAIMNGRKVRVAPDTWTQRETQYEIELLKAQGVEAEIVIEFEKGDKKD